MKKIVAFGYVTFLIILFSILYCFHKIEYLFGLVLLSIYILWFIYFLIDFSEDENNQKEKTKPERPLT